MATCRYCGARKGKRSCPALGGIICAQCCGQHRLVEIACPSTCEYLGALALVSQQDGTFTAQDYTTVWDNLKTFAGNEPDLRHPAIGRFFENLQPAEWEMALGTGYLYYGHRGADGRRLVDRYLALRGKHLPAGEVAALVALQRAWASLFEVVSIGEGGSVELRDLLAGENLTLATIVGGTPVVGELIFGWILPQPGRLELTGAVVRVPREQLHGVFTAIGAELPAARLASPTAPDRELAGSLAWAVARVLRASTRVEPEVNFAITYDAGRAPVAELWQQVGDSAKLTAIIAHHEDLEPHPAIPDPRRHAGVHIIVENQLAGGEPPETREALGRLTTTGLTRHEAIHAIGSVVAEALAKVARDGVPFDRDGAVRQLAELRADDWHF